jgi:hypothetical protein
LAADGHERPERYHRYLTALAEEEQAAVEVARGSASMRIRDALGTE